MRRTFDLQLQPSLHLVLLWRHENRLFQFRPGVLGPPCRRLGIPIAWSYGIVGDQYFDAAVTNLLWTTLHPPSWSEYVADFVAFPFSVTIHLLPASALAIYSLYSRRFEFLQRSRSIDIAIGLVGSLVAIPLYQRYFRGNYAEIARMILAHVGEQPIYATDVTAVGSSLVANLNTMRPSRPPITSPPPNFSPGYVLAGEVEPNLGNLSLTFSVGRNADGKRTRYLLCRGPACSQPKAP